MKINIKEEREEELKVGDIVKFNDGIIGLIVNGDGCEYKTKEGYGCVLLKYSAGNDCFNMAGIYINDLNKKRYTLLAHADEWEINIKK